MLNKSSSTLYKIDQQLDICTIMGIHFLNDSLPKHLFILDLRFQFLNVLLELIECIYQMCRFLIKAWGKNGLKNIKLHKDFFLSLFFKHILPNEISKCCVNQCFKLHHHADQPH